MIDIIVVILIILGIILTIIAMERDEYVLWLLATVAWMAAALGCLEVEIPYQMFNASSGAIETGTQIFSIHGATYLFMGIGLITLVEFATNIISILGDKKRWK